MRNNGFGEADEEARRRALQQKADYKAELEQQIRLKQRKEERVKRENEERDRREEAAAAAPQRQIRGGGGEPFRDADGNIDDSPAASEEEAPMETGAGRSESMGDVSSRGRARAARDAEVAPSRC